MLSMIVLCFAFVFAVGAALSWPNLGQVSLGWLALALFILAVLLRGVVI
jgi:hypothetical protein